MNNELIFSPTHTNPSVEDDNDIDTPMTTDPPLPINSVLELANPSSITVEPPPAMPTPTAAPNPGPRRSPRTPSPSRWRALLDSVEFTSRTDLAVTESKQAARNLKEHQDTVHDERR